MAYIIAVIVTGLMLIVAGCVSETQDAAVSVDHPANPQTMTATLPEASSRLVVPDVQVGGGRPMTQPAPGNQSKGHAGDENAQPAQGSHGEHGGNPSPATNPVTEPASAIRYVCPMHPEVVSDVPGTCPQCKMQLARQPLEAKP